MKLGKVLFGLVAGAAVGATIGLLFAPKKGSVTRRYISKKGNEFREKVEGKFNEFVDNVNEKVESVKEEAARLIKSGKIKVEEAETKLNNAAN